MLTLVHAMTAGVCVNVYVCILNINVHWVQATTVAQRTVQSHAAAAVGAISPIVSPSRSLARPGHSPAVPPAVPPLSSSQRHGIELLAHAVGSAVKISVTSRHASESDMFV